MPDEPGRLPAAERILAAAKALFAREGYASVAVRDIAEAAGVSKANIFHHFASKEALYLEVLRRSCESARALLQALEAEEAEPAERLRRFMRGDLERALGDLDGTRLLLAEAFDATPARARALVDEVFGADFRRLTGIVAGGQRDGAWRRDLDPALLATLMIAANTFFTAHREVLRQLPGVDFAEAPERYADTIVEVLLDGIRAAPSDGGAAPAPQAQQGDRSR